MMSERKPICMVQPTGHRTNLAAAAMLTMFTMNWPEPLPAQSTPPEARQIVVGQEIRSGIDSNDRRIGSQYSEDYRLHRNQGGRIRIDMDASGSEMRDRFDPVLRLLGPNGQEHVNNDDRGDGTLNSRIIYSATETGDHVVRAQGLGSSIGPY